MHLWQLRKCAKRHSARSRCNGGLVRSQPYFASFDQITLISAVDYVVCAVVTPHLGDEEVQKLPRGILILNSVGVFQVKRRLSEDWPLFYFLRVVRKLPTDTCGLWPELPGRSGHTPEYRQSRRCAFFFHEGHQCITESP